MNRSITLGLASAALALALASTASASCSDRKTTGTVLGGIGGALIGNSISHGGGGLVVGGIGGAVAGNAIAGSGCNHYRRADYGRDGYAYRQDQYAPRSHAVYYDHRGNRLPDGEPAPYALHSYSQAAYRSPNCASQSFYDARGNLVQQPTNCR